MKNVIYRQRGDCNKKKNIVSQILNDHCEEGMNSVSEKFFESTT